MNREIITVNLVIISLTLLSLALLCCNVVQSAVVWQSYSDFNHTQQCETFTGDYHIVYMHGAGFNDQKKYRVRYLDTLGYSVWEHDPVSVSGGVINSQCDGWNYPNGNPGLWTCEVWLMKNGAPFSLVTTDTFTVEISALPEFPHAVAGIIVAGCIGGIYLVLRKKCGKQ